MAATNLHATGVVVADRGILIAGASGAGKSSLAMALIRTSRPAWLLADDQVLLSACGGRLIASAPPATAGLVEIRGLGPVGIDHERRAVVDLIVRLVGQAEVPRLDPGESETMIGCRVASIRLPQRCIEASVPALVARIAAIGRDEIARTVAR